MRQVAVLPSGVQNQKNGQILHFNNEYIFYASTLAVYVLNAQTFVLERILSLNPKAIVSITFSPSDSNLMVVSSLDGSICLWSVQNEEMLSRIQLKPAGVVVWDPFEPNICGLCVTGTGPLKLYDWDVSRAGGVLVEILSMQNEALQSSVVRWNPNLRGQIAIGGANGAVFLYNKHTKDRKYMHKPDRKNPVRDLQWDRLSSSYLLVAYSFYISLWDASSGTEIHCFEQQTAEITGVAWLDWTAGNFVTTNARNANLKVWNASQKAPLDTMKFPGSAGLHAIVFCAGTKRALCAAEDGSVSVVNAADCRVEFVSSAGHKETIFDCKLSPTSPNVFCTASYDSTVKVWGVDLQLQTTLHGNGDVIYSCDWSPKGSMIAAASSSGLVTVWDLESGRELARYLHHSKAAFCVAWNRHSENLVASTSGDGALIIFHVSFDALYDPHRHVHTGSRRAGGASHREQLTPSDVAFRFVHPAAVYGVAWSPTHAPVLATGCHDGTVRVFNHIMKESLIYLCVGHKLRSFGVSWSYLVAGMLASGADDKLVIVWKVQLDRSVEALSKGGVTAKVAPWRELAGHTANVRALSWNSEHRNILLSGGWDCSIRLWDAFSGNCLLVVNDHVADVYSIVSHPSRPFTYISASRDTTVRVWELEGIATRLRYQAMWDGCLDRMLDKSAFNPDKVQFKSAQKEEGEGSKPQGLSDSRSTTLLLPRMHGRTSADLNVSLSHISPKADEGRDDGKEGEERFERLLPSDPLKLAGNYYKIYSFFNGASGSLDVWENALTIFGDREASILKHTQSFSGLSLTPQLRPPGMRQVHSESEVLHAARSEARRLESSKMGLRKTELQQRGETQLRQAALLYARVGDFAKYCQIMVDLGDWTSALAMAPSVSLDYWKSLSQRYAQTMLHSELCIPHLLASGKDADAVEFYLRRADPHNALLVAKMSEMRVDLIPDYVVSLVDRVGGMGGGGGGGMNGRASGVSDEGKGKVGISLSNLDPFSFTDQSPLTPLSMRSRTAKEVEEGRLIVKVVGFNSAKAYLAAACPFLAAAQFLAIGDAPTAVATLSNNFEYDSALALALCFDLDPAPHLLLLADRCASLNALSLGIEMLKTLPRGGWQGEGAQSKGEGNGNSNGTGAGGGPQAPQADQEIALLLSRHCDETQAAEATSLHGLRTAAQWGARAKEEEEIGSDAEAVLSYVSARSYSRAVRLGLGVLKRFVREPLDLTPGTRTLIRGLKYVRVEQVEEALRMPFLLTLLWFTAHEAASLGLWDTGCCMLATLLAHHSMGFALGATDVQYQLLFFTIAKGPEREGTQGAQVGQGAQGEGADESGGALDMARTVLKAHAAQASGPGNSSPGGSGGGSGGDATTLADLRQLVEILKTAVGGGGGGVVDVNAVLVSSLRAGPRRGDDVWGERTQSILALVHKMSDGLSLPSVAGDKMRLLRSRPSSGVPGAGGGRSQVEFSSDFLEKNASSVLHGSLLPTSNHALKLYTSAISKRRIRGRVVALGGGGGGGGAYASINEAVSWRRVNPYSPTLDGTLI